MEVQTVELVRDYPMLKSWWEARSFPPANPEFMPPTGLLVHQGELGICAGFLFKSDANAAIIGNIVSNPEAPGGSRSQALDVLIDSLIEIARGEGYGMVCCSTNLPRVMDRFKQHGFVQTDELVSHFGRIL